MDSDVRDLMKQVSRIRIVARRLSRDVLPGEYRAAFRGQGVEFDQVREYVPGDDIRSIDWNVTARMGRPFVKTFREERELTILFLVDVSGSQMFGSDRLTKSDVSAYLTCLLAMSATGNHDKVGLILFSDRADRYLRPRKGRTAALRVVREVLAARAPGRGTDIGSALSFLNRVQKKRAIVFLISDFRSRPFSRELRMAAGKHDLICCPVSDPRENTIPDIGLVEFCDPETGRMTVADTGSAAFRQTIADNETARRRDLQSLFERCKADIIPAGTDKPFLEEARNLFRRRSRRRNGI